MPEKIDKTSGIVVRVDNASVLDNVPDKKTISAIEKVSGKNPPAINLRDHPELSGMEFVCGVVRFGEGDIGGKHTTYVVAGGWLVKPGANPTKEDAAILVTGSGNVYARLADAWLKDALPVRGTLRRGGRAWFLD